MADGATSDEGPTLAAAIRAEGDEAWSYGYNTDKLGLMGKGAYLREVADECESLVPVLLELANRAMQFSEVQNAIRMECDMYPGHWPRAEDVARRVIELAAEVDPALEEQRQQRDGELQEAAHAKLRSYMAEQGFATPEAAIEHLESRMLNGTVLATGWTPDEVDHVLALMNPLPEVEGPGCMSFKERMALGFPPGSERLMQKPDHTQQEG